MARCAGTLTEIPRESNELIPLYVSLDGASTADYEYAVVPKGSRPSTWTAAFVAGADNGFLTGGLTPGRYVVFTKIVVGPETIVTEAGEVQVT